MPDLTAQSLDPTVFFSFFDPGPPVLGYPEFRIRSDGGLWVTHYNNLTTTWTDRFKFTITENTSFGDLVIDKSDPTVTFDTGGTNDYDITSDGSKVQVKEGSNVLLESSGSGHKFRSSSADLLLLTGTGHTSKENLTIETTVPTITFIDTTPTAGFTVKVDGGSLFVTDASDDTFMQIRASDSVFMLNQVTGGLSHTEVRIEPRDTYGDCHVEVGYEDGTRGKVHIHRDDTENAERMGVLVLQDKAGVEWYIWVDRNGGSGAQKLRMANTNPGVTENHGSWLIGP